MILRNLQPLLLLPAAAFILVPAGCAQYNDASRATRDATRTAILSDEYRDAVEAHAAGDYGLAVGLIENSIDRIPDPARREHLQFLLGDSFQRIDDFPHAEEAYRDYLALWPEGEYAPRVEQNLIRLRAAQALPELAAEERLAAARADQAQLLELERQFPADPRIKYYLGNIYYETGDYETAGRYYFEAQSLEAAFEEKDLLRERLFLDSEGQPSTLTPEELRERDLLADPLVVIDVYPYRQRADGALIANQVLANVTGKVQNRSPRVAHDVVLEVRFVNRLNDILDLQVIPLGDMPPGSVRPFLAQANNFDNIYNITDIQVFAREGG